MTRFHVLIIFMASLAFAGYQGYMYYSLKWDTDYPAAILYEQDYFTDEDGNRINEVESGGVVYLRKAFCVSLDEDPEKMVAEASYPQDYVKPGNEREGQEQEEYFGRIRGVIRATYINGLQLSVPSQHVNISPGCYRTVRVIEIPLVLPVGEHRLRFEYTYYRNVPQWEAGKGVFRRTSPIQFTIVNPEGVK